MIPTGMLLLLRDDTGCKRIWLGGMHDKGYHSVLKSWTPAQLSKVVMMRTVEKGNFNSAYENYAEDQKVHVALCAEEPEPRASSKSSRRRTCTASSHYG